MITFAFRCPLYRGEAHHGDLVSKRHYFFGLRIHLLLTVTGQPVEFMLVPGTQVDIAVFKALPLDFPEDSPIYADTAYTDYEWKDRLAQESHFHLIVLARSTRRARCWLSTLSLLLPSQASGNCP